MRNFFFEVFSEPGSGVRFSKAGAKVRSCFQTAKCFAKFFSKVFSKTGRKGNRPLGPLLRKAGQQTPESPGSVRKTLCNIMSSINASFPKAGAKVRLITGSANLYRLFLEGFPKVFHKRLIYKCVIKQVFHGQKRRGEEGTHYNIPGGRAVRARITITITIRGKGHTISVNRRHTGGEHGAQGMKTGCRQGETVVQGGENNGLRKGKQWFSEKKVSPIEEYFFLFQPQKVFPITEKEMKD